MSHEIVLKLSKEIELVLPQLFAATIARKAIFVFVYAVISVCSPLIKSRHYVLFNDCYRDITTRLKYLWVCIFVALALYAFYDIITNVNDFMNCRQHAVPRPLGIFCAFSLLCFVFTTKISTSVLCALVMLCAKDFNPLTGMSCILLFSEWAGLSGTSIILIGSSTLAAVNYVFCRTRSSAAFAGTGLAISMFWTWMTIISRFWKGLFVGKRK